jgi:hypothetical protein
MEIPRIVRQRKMSGVGLGMKVLSASAGVTYSMSRFE